MLKLCGINLALGSIVLAVLNSCSTATESCVDVNQDRIYQSLTAHFDEQNNETAVTARLTFGDSTGTTLRMDGKCRVAHDSMRLEKREYWGTSYESSGRGKMGSHEFTFSDSQGRTFVNHFSINDVAFDVPPVSLSKIAGGTIRFIAKPALAGSGDEVRVEIEDFHDGNDYASVSVESGAVITVKPDDLQYVQRGSHRMRLVRRTTAALQQATAAGGLAEGSYATDWVNVSID